MAAKSISELLSAVFKVSAESISGDAKLNEISGWDSLKHMNLIITLETEYGVQFDMDEIIAMDSPGTIRSTLQSKGVDV